MNDDVETVEPRSFEHEEPWHRKAELIGVDFPNRTIDLVVIPYGQEVVVGWEGRTVTETIERGAFNGIERRANRIKANRDHDERRTFGRALTLHPERDEGLVGTVKVSRTPLGDETLELAEDGVLDVSAGFLPMAGGMRWLSRNAYRIVKGHLRHIALVPEGAYGEAAGVLAVRAAAHGPLSSTPNLDQALAWQRELELARGAP